MRVAVLWSAQGGLAWLLRELLGLVWGMKSPKGDYSPVQERV